MVRWADGETTLYTDVDSRGFLHENKLKSPNDTWRHATVLAAETSPEAPTGTSSSAGPTAN